MSVQNTVLRGDERAALLLRELYSRFGYTQYKMNKFEEYDLYVSNKDFLTSDRVITFTDTNGKLLALKPDVTLSIVKNTQEKRGEVEKLYYQENVYRVSGKSESFREIMQVGLECIGKVDDYCLFEVLTLAAKSLAVISPAAVLNISHLGIVSAVLDSLGVTEQVRAKLLQFIGEKNLHEMTALCESAGVPAEKIEVLSALVCNYGKPSEVLPQILPRLATVLPTDMTARFADLLLALEKSACGAAVCLDFSVIGDIGYYNGIVFKGFVAGVPEGLLSGGEYSGLLRKMGRAEQAIGFAVYMGALERLFYEAEHFDVDTVVLYGEDAAPAALLAATEALTASGETVLAAKALPAGLRARRVVSFDGKEGRILEGNA